MMNGSVLGKKALEEAFCQDSSSEKVYYGGERIYSPLRKKIKNKLTGDESNFVSSYRVNDSCAAMDENQNEVQLFRLENRIEVDGKNVANPCRRFEEMGLLDYTIGVLRDIGIQSPTPIQMQAIPCVLSGRDVVGLAETGSGKTLCYILPLLNIVQQQKYSSYVGPLALIVVPTRELMFQILQLLRSFSASGSMSFTQDMLVMSSLFTAVGICGGVDIKNQFHIFRSYNVEVIVATPGRLLHLVDQSKISLKSLKYLVLDEVDKMLDLDLEPQLRLIIQNSKEIGRQTLLFSATLPHFLERLARSAVLNPVTIHVNMGYKKTGISAESIVQRVIFMKPYNKREKLLEVLRGTSHPPVLVFCNSQSSVDQVVKFLRFEQFHAAGIHADKSQEFRFKVMTAYREGYLDVLVATDLASRGIDVSDISHVIIYEMPHSIDDYIHRCGRTGRAGKYGLVTSFLTSNCSIAKELKNLLKESGQSVPPELENSKRFTGTNHIEKIH